MALKLGLVGIGKIAHDQHIPALAADPRFELVATASRNASVDGVASFTSVEAMLDGVPELDAISICTPPQAHFDAAIAALRAGKHVMLEKPPAATTRQIALLQAEAARHGRTLFQTWHSRFAAGVDAARDWVKARTLTGAPSPGRKTCTTGTPASSGSSTRAAWACSTPASTRCRC